MKTNRAIFWATIAIINTLTGIQQDGIARYVCAAIVGLALFTLLWQTREQKVKVSCVRCGRDVRVSKERITACACGVKHSWHP